MGNMKYVHFLVKFSYEKFVVDQLTRLHSFKSKDESKGRPAGGLFAFKLARLNGSNGNGVDNIVD
jgi:hypothetical protein